MPFEGYQPDSKERSDLEIALANMRKSRNEIAKETVDFPAGDNWSGRYLPKYHMVELSHNNVRSKISLRGKKIINIEVFDANGNALLEDSCSPTLHRKQYELLSDSGLLPFQKSN